MNTMTNRGKRPNQQTGKLKALLLTGSVIATLAGMQVLPLQEPAATEMPATAGEPVTIVVPAADGAVITLPPANRKAQLELNPIPQAVQPQINPVARTRSSR